MSRHASRGSCYAARDRASSTGRCVVLSDRDAPVPRSLRYGVHQRGAGRRGRRARSGCRVGSTVLPRGTEEADPQPRFGSSINVVQGSRRRSHRVVSASCTHVGPVVPIRTVHPWRTCGFVDRHCQLLRIPPRAVHQVRSGAFRSSPLDHCVGRLKASDGRVSALTTSAVDASLPGVGTGSRAS